MPRRRAQNEFPRHAADAEIDDDEIEHPLQGHRPFRQRQPQIAIRRGLDMEAHALERRAQRGPRRVRQAHDQRRPAGESRGAGHLRLRHGRAEQGEGRPFARPAVHRHRPPHGAGTLPAQREAQAEPFRRRVGAFEPLEDPVLILGRDAGSGIGDGDPDHVASVRARFEVGAQLHVAGGGAADGVAQQVDDDLAHPRRIHPPRSAQGRIEPGAQRELLALRLRREQGCDTFEQTGDVGRIGLRRAAAGEREQAVEHGEQRGAAATQMLHPTALVILQCPVQQQIADAEDALHRPAHVVADRGQGHVLLAADGFGRAAGSAEGRFRGVRPCVRRARGQRAGGGRAIGQRRPGAGRGSGRSPARRDSRRLAGRGRRPLGATSPEPAARQQQQPKQGPETQQLKREPHDLAAQDRPAGGPGSLLRHRRDDAGGRELQRRRDRQNRGRRAQGDPRDQLGRFRRPGVGCGRDRGSLGDSQHRAGRAQQAQTGARRQRRAIQDALQLRRGQRGAHQPDHRPLRVAHRLGQQQTRLGVHPAHRGKRERHARGTRLQRRREPVVLRQVGQRLGQRIGGGDQPAGGGGGEHLPRPGQGDLHAQQPGRQRQPIALHVLRTDPLGQAGKLGEIVVQIASGRGRRAADPCVGQTVHAPPDVAQVTNPQQRDQHGHADEGGSSQADSQGAACARACWWGHALSRFEPEAGSGVIYSPLCYNEISAVRPPGGASSAERSSTPWRDR